ncbi:MAG TPA: hypothetical protein DDW52_12510 [Planctomycetaceae bacterium]|nr:hypothetical protein [Planctomycetaceae bacterium]
MKREVQGTEIRGKRKWLRRLGILGIALLILTLALPTLLVNRTVLVPVINRFGGIAPLKFDAESISGGWLSSVAVSGVSLTDGDGKQVVKVYKVQTSKTLLSWILSSSDLGRIEINGLEATVVAGNGTTDLEQKLEPILAPAEPPPDDSPTTPPTGTFVITDSSLLLTEKGRREQWIVELPTVEVNLANNPLGIGLIDASARIGEATGVAQVQPGAIRAKLLPDDSGKLTLDGRLEQLPLGIWHVVRGRLPDLPFQELGGTLSGQVSGYYHTLSDWQVTTKDVAASRVRIDAPAVLGEDPAELQFLKLSGDAAVREGELSARAVSLQCDFANTIVDANLPWPLPLPSLERPFFEKSKLSARGVVDLPKLAAAARTLLPLRDGLDLQSGSVQFAISHQPPNGQDNAAAATIQIADLAATLDGQPVRSEAPFVLTANLHDRASPAIDAVLQSSFANLKAGGSLKSGQLTADVDLAKLNSEAGNWLSLPFSQMDGTAQCSSSWQLDETSQLTLAAFLQTSPLLLASLNGQIQEPAWTGRLDAKALLQGGIPTRLTSAALRLEATGESLVAEIKDPILLNTDPDAAASQVAPARFNASLTGELASWQRRSSLFLAEPLGFQIGGQISVAAEGGLTLDGAVLTAANWRAQPLSVDMEGMSFSEPQMIGNFRGLVDTNNLLRLQVDDLTVQSTALSLAAKDAANPDGTRVGNSAFRLDLGRLMNNVTVPADPESSAVTALQGTFDGNAQWTIAETLSVALSAKGNGVNVLSKSQENPAGDLLWSEQTLGLNIRGQYATDVGHMNVDSMTMQTDWLTYAGTVKYTPASAADVATQDGGGPVVLASATSDSVSGVTSPAKLSVAGQIDYDCAQLSQKIMPLTGGNVSLSGRRQVPLQVDLTFSPEPDAVMLRGLNAHTQLGWEQARVVGIDIGEAVVPIDVRDGVLQTKAEMQVSQGALRWDVHSDLAAEELAVELAPMTVIENVALTEPMCAGWLKYIAPLIAETTSVDGRLTLNLQHAHIVPARPAAQTVQGQLQIFDARVGPGPMLTNVLAVVTQVEAMRAGQLAPATPYQKTWIDLPEQLIKFNMADGQVRHENMNVRIGDVRISTSGTVAVDGRVDLVAQMPIPDDWADKGPILAGLRGQSLQFPVQGTLSQPQINTDFLRQFGRQAVRGAAEGLLQKGLSRGLERLFGEQPDK